MDKSEQTGNAAFDRGKITDKRNRDHWQYKVESYTRKGVGSRWMEAVGAIEYVIGCEVYFFMFADGRGMILGEMCRDT